MKLISMTKFILNINELVPKDYDQFFDSRQNKKLSIIENYANFLENPLELKMFIPCKNGKLFTEIEILNLNEFEKAKEEVLFNGFSIRIDADLKVLLHEETKCVRTFFNFNDAFKGLKVEDLTHKNYELTPNAIKRIFG